MSHPNVRVPRRQNMLFKVTFIIKRAYLVLYHNNILCQQYSVANTLH